MAILSGDLKFYASDTMNDTVYGGGAQTGTLIVDGESNNIFDDISNFDRTHGGFKVRKIFPSINAQNDDKLLGAHVIISKIPTDEKVGVCLMTTDDHYDRRPDMISQFEDIITVNIYSHYGGGTLDQYSSGNSFILRLYATTVSGDIQYAPDVYDKLCIGTSKYCTILQVKAWSTSTYDYVDLYLSHGYSNSVTHTGDLHKTTFVQPIREIFSANRLSVAASINDTSLTVASTKSLFTPADTYDDGNGPIGMDLNRIPRDGEVLIYDPQYKVVVLHDLDTVIATPTNGNTETILNDDLSARSNMAKITVKDDNGDIVDPSKYTTNLTVGSLTWVDVSGIVAPATITSRIEDMVDVTSTDDDTGVISFSPALTHNFVIDETLVSSAVLYDDLFPHTTVPFDQQTWTNEWSDVVIRDSTYAQYNLADYPIALTSASTIEERWAVIFVTSDTVNIIGEHIGVVNSAILPISSDIAPINPRTGQPYFTIPSSGWGNGWSAGNVLRFNTISASKPLWVTQVINKGAATDPDTNFCLEFRGEIDT